MPELSDVIGYEENDPTIKQKIKSGYPRFISHPFIVKIQQYLKQKFGISNGKEVILISSQNSALSELFEYTSKNYDIINDRNVTAVCVPKDSIESGKIRLFLQHTEVTTNPLIQTPDLPGIHRLAAQNDIPVIVDATFGTPYNVKVTPYADIIIESLTKFASGNADLLMGALIINEKFSFYTEIKQNIQKFIEPPFEGDIRRLAFEITGYESRIKTINKNTLELVEYFKNCTKVKQIYWPYQDLTKDNYQAIQKHPHAIGGVISVIFTEPLKNIYDRIKLPKGPSLGTEFTLLMPYVYLAHYDLMSTEKGRKYLKSFGIYPDLLRISVGIEDSKRIIETFDQVLS